jgi:hypothetical protein
MKKTKKYTLAIALLYSGLLLMPRQSRAQSIAAHFGTFTKPAFLNDCLAYANTAIREEHLELFERGGYVRIGGNANVMVQVVCIPTAPGSPLSVTVSAFSTDSKLAELTRNRVREKIVRMQRID